MALRLPLRSQSGRRVGRPGRVESPMTRAPFQVSAPRPWSRSLFYQAVSVYGGEELRIFAGEMVFRWLLHSGTPATVGAQRVLIERSLMIPGRRVAGSRLWDEGSCFVEPWERGALGHFLLGYNDGELTLSLAGVKVWGTFQFVRTSVLEGLDAEWMLRRLAAAKRVA